MARASQDHHHPCSSMTEGLEPLDNDDPEHQHRVREENREHGQHGHHPKRPSSDPNGM